MTCNSMIIYARVNISYQFTRLRFWGFIQQQALMKIQSNSVLMNTAGPSIFVRYNREML